MSLFGVEFLKKAHIELKCGNGSMKIFKLILRDLKTNFFYQLLKMIKSIYQ